MNLYFLNIYKTIGYCLTKIFYHRAFLKSFALIKFFFNVEMKYKHLNEKPNRYKCINVYYCYNDWLRKECVQLMRTHHNVDLDHGE